MIQGLYARLTLEDEDWDNASRDKAEAGGGRKTS